VSTTPRRNARGSSLRSARAKREVEDAGERRRADPGEDDEREDAAARRALNDPPDRLGDNGPDDHQRGGEQRTAERDWMVPGDRGRDAEQSREGPPAPAYRRRPAHGESDRGNDERDIRRRVGEERAQPEDQKRARVEAAQQPEDQAGAERDERHEERAEARDIARPIDARGVPERRLGHKDRDARDIVDHLGAEVVHERPARVRGARKEQEADEQAGGPRSQRNHRRRARSDQAPGTGRAAGRTRRRTSGVAPA